MQKERNLKESAIEALENYQEVLGNYYPRTAQKIYDLKTELIYSEDVDEFQQMLEESITNIKERIYKLSLFLSGQKLDYPEVEEVIEDLESDLSYLLETRDSIISSPVDDVKWTVGTNYSNDKENALNEEEYCPMCGCDDIDDEDYEPDQNEINEYDDDCKCPYCKIEMLEDYIDSLEKDNNNLEIQVEDYEKQIDTLKYENDILKEDNENLFDENCNVIEQLQEEDKENELLKVKILEEKLENNIPKCKIAKTKEMDEINEISNRAFGVNQPKLIDLVNRINDKLNNKLVDDCLIHEELKTYLPLLQKTEEFSNCKLLLADDYENLTGDKNECKLDGEKLSGTLYIGLIYLSPMLYKPFKKDEPFRNVIVYGNYKETVFVKDDNKKYLRNKIIETKNELQEEEESAEQNILDFDSPEMKRVMDFIHGENFNIVEGYFRISSIVEKMEAKKMGNDLIKKVIYELYAIYEDENLVVAAMPICKYNGEPYSIEEKFDIEQLKTLLKTKKVIIYLPEGEVDGKVLYRCALVK